MAYSPDVIKTYVDNMLANGATYKDVANAAQQFGVPIEDVYSTYGFTNPQGSSLLASQPLTSTQVQGARDYINGLGYGTFNFDGDFTGRDPVTGQVEKQLLGRVLGAGQALGLSPAEMAQITGTSVGAYNDAFGIFDPEGLGYSDYLAAQGRIFMADNPGMGDASRVTDRYLTTRNPDGTYTYTERAGVNDSDGIGFREAYGMPQEDRAGSGRGRFGGAGMQGYGNPYLQSMSDAISRNFTNTLSEQWLPMIRDQSVAAGGLGGSRAGVAQAGAIDKAGQGLSSALSNLWGGAWESDQARQMQRYGIDTNAALGWGGLENQRYGMDQNFSLGMGGLGLQNQGQWMNYGLGLGGLDNQRYGMDLNYNLGNQGQMLNFWDSERDNDRADLGMGMNLYGMGVMGPWGPITNAAGVYDNFTGYGTGTSNSSSGGGALGALGGAGLGYQWWRGLGGN